MRFHYDGLEPNALQDWMSHSNEAVQYSIAISLCRIADALSAVEARRAAQLAAGIADIDDDLAARRLAKERGGS